MEMIDGMNRAGPGANGVWGETGYRRSTGPRHPPPGTRYAKAASPPRSASVRFGGKSRYSSGILLRLTQSALKPTEIPALTSQRLEDTKVTSPGAHL